jgi:hypothetical protein
MSGPEVITANDRIRISSQRFLIQHRTLFIITSRGHESDKK